MIRITTNTLAGRRALIAGLVGGVLVCQALAPPSQPLGSSLARLDAQIPLDLGPGEYLFLPNRRSVWVVHQTAGRFANYRFLNDEAQTVERSQVITLDRELFPADDTVFRLSDRNFTEVLWVANRRTGLIQLWVPKADGHLEARKPVAAGPDLVPE